MVGISVHNICNRFEGGGDVLLPTLCPVYLISKLSFEIRVVRQFLIAKISNKIF